MQSRLDEIKALDATVLAISTNNPDENLKLAESAGLDFPLLCDTMERAMNAYGLRHENASIDGGDIARPAVFIIDREGKVAWRALTDNWRVRVRPETIIEELKAIP